MESMGFVYSEYLTKKMRKVAQEDWKRSDLLRGMKNHPKKKTFGVGQHLIKTLQVRLVLDVHIVVIQLAFLTPQETYD